MTQPTPTEIDSASNEVSHNGEAASNQQALMVRDYNMQGLSPYVAAGYGGNYVDAAPAGLSFSQLLHSLRRRWLLALIVGIVMGLPLAALLWIVAPENYEVVAWLKVGDPQQWSETKPGRDGAEYEAYRQTQAARIRSPMVLQEALNKEGVASLPLLRAEKDQHRFLEDEITVVTPRDSELLQIKMRGKDPQQLVKIVNAVKDSYLDNVVEVENRENVGKLTLLQNTLNELQNDISNKRDQLQKLQEKTKSPDLDSVKFQYNLLVQQSGSIMNQMSRTREDLARIAKQLRILQSDKPTDIPDYQVEQYLLRDDQIADMTKQATNMQMAIDYAMGASRLGDRDPQVKDYKNKLAALQSRLEERRRELRPEIIKQLKTDLASQDGVKADPEKLEIEKKQLTDDLVTLQKNLDDVVAETTKLGTAS
ncbi:MAG TPA: Wzz/FepE/Etk N-terminal domain-containing protein, partial [Pirellulales bacterium]|nr:Wzz/FepE/Etk N-terminal domain-containing protein [Pirellulales bacterium]